MIDTANHSQQFGKFGFLQMFAEGDPDPAPTEQAPTVPVDPNPEPPQEPFLKVKYLHEEMDLDREKAIELAQKGLNHDRLKERLDALESDPGRHFVENLAKRFNMTVPQYLEAVRVQEEEDRLQELVQQNIPEEYAKEIVENRKFREQFQAKEQAEKTKTQQEAEFQTFLETFPDVKPEDVPQSVWAEVGSGKSLVDAYTRHENQLLKQKLADAEKGKKIDEQNAANAAASTGPVAGGGDGGTTTFFTKSQVDKMSDADVNRNWKAINESMKRKEFYD